MEYKEYELTDEQYKKLILAISEASRQPVMMVGGHGPRSPQAVANDIWNEIGREVGFDGASVRPVPGKGERHFSAMPVRQKLHGRGRLNLVFEGDPTSLVFIEAEDAYGAGVACGKWLKEGDRSILVIDALP